MIKHIIRRKNPFVMIDKTPLRDPCLSYKAKGILAYLLSYPDHWEVKTQDICDHATDGREAVMTGMRELRKAGYAEIVTEQDESGKMLGRYWAIYEDPIAPSNGEPGKPLNGKPSPRLNRATASRRQLNNKGNIRMKKSKIDPAVASTAGLIPGASHLGDGEDQKQSPSHSLTKRFHQFLIKNRLLVGRKRPSLSSWARTCAELLEQLDGDYQRVERVLSWYVIHHRDEFVPACHAMTTFCDRFLQVERAMLRAASDRRDNGVREVKPRVKACKTEEEFWRD